MRATCKTRKALKRLNSENSVVSVNTCKLIPQKGIIDCGLYALAYAIAICEISNPTALCFKQELMREHYNRILRYETITQFPFKLNVKKTIYKQHFVNINDFNLKY